MELLPIQLFREPLLIPVPLTCMSKYKSFSKFACVLCLAAPLAAFDAGISLRAAEAHVDVINFAFVPNSITVNVNDSVVWTWQPGANFHNVFSDSVPAAWPASPVASAPFTFTNTFNSGG